MYVLACAGVCWLVLACFSMTAFVADTSTHISDTQTFHPRDQKLGEYFVLKALRIIVEKTQTIGLTFWIIRFKGQV